MGETSATRTVNGYLRSIGAHVQRIESPMTSPGVPDTNVCLNGCEMWLEGKFLKALPVRRSTPVKFGGNSDKRLKHQGNWLEMRRKNGGRCFVWIRVEDEKWYVFKDDFRRLSKGSSREDFERHSFDTAREMINWMVDQSS